MKAIQDKQTLQKVLSLVGDADLLVEFANIMQDKERKKKKKAHMGGKE